MAVYICKYANYVSALLKLHTERDTNPVIPVV